MSSNKRLVIVGAGGSGMAAAVAALQSRPDIEVTIVERNCSFGGVTAISTGTLRACETSLQKAQALAGVTLADSLLQYLDITPGRQDLAMLQTYLEQSPRAIEWLQSLGCRLVWLSDFRHQIVPEGKGVPGGSGLTIVLHNKAIRLGVRFRYETRAISLVQKEGKIVGLEALEKDGEKVSLAAEAVILCDGGFWGAGKGAFTNNIPAHLKEVVILDEGYFYEGGAGDGARMAQAAGASIEDMDVLTYVSQQYVDAKGRLCNKVGSGSLWSDGAAIILNQNLQRFVNEDLCFAKESLTDGIASELVNRHEKWFWNILDLQSKNNTYRIRQAIEQGLIEEGFILTSDTLEGLAAEMKVSVDQLHLAISRYNRYFEQGLEKDLDLGRDLKRKGAHAINTPPYFAIRSGIKVGNTRGGIVADHQARVLDQHKNPIPGLYVAGSSMDCVKFDGMKWLNGTGLTNCVVWGRIAGENAASAVT